MKALLLLFCTSALAFSPGDFVDKSQSCFFPKEFGAKLTSYNLFPVFWWNFLVIQPKKGRSVLKVADAVCQDLKKRPEFLHVECEPDPAAYLPVIRDWAGDVTLRSPPPSDLRSRFSVALSQVSLPIPKGVFDVLRVDPLGTSRELREMLQSRLKLGLEFTGGFFQDKESGVIAIPLQVGFPPAEGERIDGAISSVTQLCAGSSDCEHLALLGPHGSTLENRRQITRDLNKVSWVAGAVLLFVCLTVLLLKQAKLALLFIPVALSTGLAALATVLIFGKIHGLTLSFGTGIIGLIIDYGLQASFNRRSKNVWKSNFVGFATTLVSLLVISFSGVPLLKQLMVFSALGFLFGYPTLYLCRDWISRKIAVEPLPLKVPHSSLLFSLTMVCVFGAFLFPFFVHPRFDLRQFDFQSAQTAHLAEWFFGRAYPQAPLFEISAKALEGSLEESHERKTFADENHLSIETVGGYIPKLADQEKNLAAWKNLQCGKSRLDSILTLNEKKLFEPFLEEVRCENLKLLSLDSHPRKYVEQLSHDGQWLTLWFPKTSSEIQNVIQKFPETSSLAEVVSIFPKLLVREMQWMFPVSLLAITLFLFLYYRKSSLCLIGLIPFFSGLGFTLGMGLFFGIPLSFVSLVAMIMVLGFSVDYAVFAMDAELGILENREATNSGLLYAAVITLLGFLPLVFCQHQVLRQLGLALTFGMVGTILGAFWGIPELLRRFR